MVWTTFTLSLITLRDCRNLLLLTEPKQIKLHTTQVLVFPSSTHWSWCFFWIDTLVSILKKKTQKFVAKDFCNMTRIVTEHFCCSTFKQLVLSSSTNCTSGDWGKPYGDKNQCNSKSLKQSKQPVWMSHSPCLTKTPWKPRSFRMQEHLLTMSDPALKGKKTNTQHLASQVCSYQWQRKVGFRPDIHSRLPGRSSKERTFSKSSKCINKIHWIKLLSQ